MRVYMTKVGALVIDMEGATIITQDSPDDFFRKFKESVNMDIDQKKLPHISLQNLQISQNPEHNPHWQLDSMYKDDDQNGGPTGG